MINKKQFNWNKQSYYYIHRHAEHFERDAAIAALKASHDSFYLEMKNRYKKNYLDSITALDDKTKELLNSAMADDSVLTEFTKEFTDKLNGTFRENIQSFDLEKNINISYKTINDYFKNNRDVKYLNDFFRGISEASKALSGNTNEIMSMLVGKNGFTSHQSLPRLSKSLDRFLTAMNGKRLNVNQQKKVQIANLLKTITNNLIENSKDLDTQSITGTAKQIFSTQLGEYIVSKGIATALSIGMGSSLEKFIRDSLSGTKNISIKEIKADKKLENYIKKFGQKGNQVFKTDNSFQNFQMKLEQNGANFKINLGLSTKWYNQPNYSRAAVSIGTESVMNRFNQMFTNAGERYYAYNILGLSAQPGMGVLVDSLKRLIATRNADFFISGLGIKGDFSQFIVVNGYFYPIWDIINSLMNEKGINDLITVDLNSGSLKDIQELNINELNKAANVYAAFKRSIVQAGLINNLKFEIKFRPNILFARTGIGPRK